MTTLISYAFPATGAPDPAGRRTLPNRLNDIINVLDWGADPTGGSDSTAAIQAAINYAYTLNPGNSSGTPVFVPRGTYLISSPGLNVSKTGGSQQGNLDFFGAGRDATILKGTYDAGFLVTKQSNADDNLHNMHDMTIWNQSTNSASGAFISFYSDNRNRFENLSFKGFSGCRVDANNFGCSVISCIATCTGSAPAGSIGFAIGQGEIAGCQATGFEKGYYTVGYGIAVFGSKALSCTYGFFCLQHCPSFIGNWSHNCGIGVWIDNCDGLNVLGNVIDGSGTTGIMMKGGQGAYFGANTIPMAGGLSFDAKSNESVQSSNVVVATQGPGGFAFPDFGSNAYSNGRWVAIQCGSNSAPIQPWVMFGTLGFNAYEGKEYNIIDAQAQASFAGVIAGGGSTNHYKIRYNGANWIRVG